MSHARAAPLARLLDANPRIDEHGRLAFDCPFHGVHPTWGQCAIAIPLHPAPGGWSIEHADDFARTTVSPSIKVTGRTIECFWHGFIRSGRFEHCGDSR